MQATWGRNPRAGRYPAALPKCVLQDNENGIPVYFYPRVSSGTFHESGGYQFHTGLSAEWDNVRDA